MKKRRRILTRSVLLLPLSFFTQGRGNGLLNGADPEADPEADSPSEKATKLFSGREKNALAKRQQLRNERAIASPQFSNGKFCNTIPEVTNQWRALRNFVTGGTAVREPVGKVPSRQLTRQMLQSLPETDFRTHWLGHSTLLVEMDGLKFLTDPVFGERASPFSFAGPKRFFEVPIALSELPFLDAVVLSHDHYDHLCAESVRFLAAHSKVFIVPLGLANRLEEVGVPHDKILEFDWWETHTIGSVTFACTPARHFSGRSLFDRNSTLWCSWSIIGKTRKFFFSGDGGMFPGFAQIGEKYGPFDLVAMETGAYNENWPDIHIGPEQGVQAFLDLKGKIYLPIHWGTFNLAMHSWTEPAERLIAEALRMGVTVAFPFPGGSVEPGKLVTNFFANGQFVGEKWWPSVPWQLASDAPIRSSGI